MEKWENMNRNIFMNRAMFSLSFSFIHSHYASFAEFLLIMLHIPSGKMNHILLTMRIFSIIIAMCTAWKVSLIAVFLVWMWENTDQKNSEYGHFSLNGIFLPWTFSFHRDTCNQLGCSLTRFWPMFPFYTPWKLQKKFSLLVFSGSIKWKHWLEMV